MHDPNARWKGHDPVSNGLGRDVRAVVAGFRVQQKENK